MEFLQKYARVIVIALLVIGVIVAISVSGSSNDEPIDEATSSESTESENTNEGPVAPETETEATESTVERTEDGVSTISAVKGDNQTVMVRKVITQFTSDENMLSPEQMLFAETNLVNELPRNDLIFVGDTVRLTDEQVESVLEQARNLSESQIAAWAQYL